MGGNHVKARAMLAVLLLFFHLLFGHEPQDGAKASKPHPEKLGQALSKDG
jgi:hypothetical protein